MKKRVLIIIFSVISFKILCLIAFICTLPTILLYITNGHYLKEGIDKYDPANSSLSLCSCLTVRGENYKEFFNNYTYIDSFYRYEEISYGGYVNETTLLVLSYDETNYVEAFNDVKSQPGFSSDIYFSYGDFEFQLNDTIKGITDFDLSSEEAYIHWINLAGWSDSRHELAFLGFDYAIQWRSGFWEYSSSYYPFTNWDTFFTEFFAYYDWE